jgi:His-Xaa-Ser system protein HxsD
VYSVDAILKTAYKFTDRLYIYIGPLAPEGPRTVALVPKFPSQAMSPIVGEFLNELIDQQLRIGLEHEFGSVRTLIMAEAFADGPKTADDDDYLRDPHSAGIRR